MNPTTPPLVAESDRLRFKMRQSPVTAALVISFIVVWVATWFDMEHVIFSRFAKVNEAVRAGEVWRLFTASFLHAGAMHLWFNGMAMGAIGPTIERVYGRLQYLIVFLLGGAVGMLASVLLMPRPSVGASAGVFALLGVLLAHATRSGKALPSQARKVLVIQVLFIVGLNIVLGLIAGFIDTAAHIGGLVGGFALGLILRARGPLVAIASPAPDASGAASSTAPAPPPPAASTRRRGRSHFGWAGQRWKMAVLFLGMAPYAISMFRDRGYFPGLELLAFFAGAAVAMSARCPKCRVRVFWWCVSKLPANKGIETALQSENCPVCGYPDAPDAAAPGTPAGAHQRAAGS